MRTKLKSAKKAGLKLYFVWESDWYDSQEKVMSEIERVIPTKGDSKLLQTMSQDY